MISNLIRAFLLQEQAVNRLLMTNGMQQLQQQQAMLMQHQQQQQHQQQDPQLNGRSQLSQKVSAIFLCGDN